MTIKGVLWLQIILICFKSALNISWVKSPFYNFRLSTANLLVDNTDDSDVETVTIILINFEQIRDDTGDDTERRENEEIKN